METSIEKSISLIYLIKLSSIAKFQLFFFLRFLLYFRKVQNESATGSVSVNKVRTTLTVQVEGIDFDTQACVLRVSGRNIQENQYVKVCLW